MKDFILRCNKERHAKYKIVLARNPNGKAGGVPSVARVCRIFKDKRHGNQRRQQNYKASKLKDYLPAWHLLSPSTRA